MRPPLVALLLALLALALLARLSCAGEGPPMVEPDSPAEAQGSAPRAAELVEPTVSAEERGTASAPPADDGEPEGSEEAPEEEEPEEAPLLLAGLVVEGRGVGVPDATVTLERHLVDSGGFGMRMVQIEELRELTTRTDAEGRFEVRGEETGEVVVIASKEGYVLHEELECTLPTTGVTLVVERGGALLVTVAPAALDLAERVLVEVRQAGATHDVDHTPAGFREGRSLRAELLPDAYDVVLVERTSRRALLTVPGVQVRPGETTEDSRLQDLDLQAVLRKIRVTVVDSEDQPLPGVTVWVHHGFGESGQTTDEEGAIELGAGADGVDVAVREAGWRRVQHRGVTEDLVVRLERPLTLRLVRPAGRSAELGDLYLYLEPVRAEGDPDAGRGSSDWTLPATENAVEVGLDAPGTYRVLWAATLTYARGSANFYPPDVEPQTFEVSGDGGTQSVTLALDVAAVDALLTRLAALRDELQPMPGESTEEHERRAMEIILRENR